jgi:sugar phosphate isomerase/epimerase
MKYLISAWEGPDRSIEWYKQFAEKLNSWGNICKKAGIGFAFHNHSFSFEKREGIIPQKF